MADDRFGELAAQDQYAPTAYLPDVPTGPDEPVSTERQRSQRAAQLARAGEGVNPVVDIIKSIPAAAARGVKSFLLQAGSGMDPIPFMPEVSQEQQRLGIEGTHEAARQMEQGIQENLYQPQTTPGHYGHSVFEIGANPINWVGPGSIPFKAGWNVISGVGGEAGAQAYKGTPYEDTARLAGSFSPMVAERAAALAPGALARLPGAVERRAAAAPISELAAQDVLPMAAPERIVGAAYRIGDRNFAAPVHSMAAEDAMSALGVKREMDLIGRQPGANLSEKLAAHRDAQGFVTSSGRFLTRDEAQRFAADTGQIRAGAQGRISGLNAEDISGQAGDAARAENRRIVGELAAQDRLPMDEASRMQRAAEQGYTVDAYKGLFPYDYKSVPSRDWKGNVIGKAPEGGPVELTSINNPGRPYAGFFSSDPNVANRFAALTTSEGAVLPAKLKFENPLVIDAKGKRAAAFQFESVAREQGTQAEFEAFVNAWKQAKHDGVILKNTGDEGTIYIPRNPQQIRSRFAAFDPAKTESGDLTAIRRQAVERDRSGRPIRTAPLPIGTEGEILRRGAERISEPERIVGAAVKGDNRVFAADQHWGAANEAGRYYNVEDPIGAGLLKDVEHDGFLTNKGRYVSREEALRIAEAAGQSKPGPLARQGRLETSETRLRLEDREGREAALAAINARLRGEPLMQAERRMGAIADPTTPITRAVKYGEAAPVVTEDPFHNFSKLRTGKTPEEMSVTVKNAPTFERPLTRPEDLLGKEIIFTPGDRSLAGGTLTHVGGTKLTTPRPFEGGPDYAFLHAGKPVPGTEAQRVWGNAPAAATGMVNLGKEVLERGREPVLMYQAMGRRALDSSKQMALPAVDLAKQGSVTNAAAKSINDYMAFKGVEDFPGWRSKDLEAWVENTTGTRRAILIKAMDMAPAHKGGFPDIGELRYGMTVPHLRSTPTGSVGQTISKFDPLAGAIDPSLHSTYTRALAGYDPATFGGSVPWHVAAPDIHAAMMRLGNPTKFAERPDYYMAGRIPKGVPRTQVADQRWVDTVSEWMRKNPLWAAAGAAPAGLGALADQGEYRQ